MKKKEKNLYKLKAWHTESVSERFYATITTRNQNFFFVCFCCFGTFARRMRADGLDARGGNNARRRLRRGEKPFHCDALRREREALSEARGEPGRRSPEAGTAPLCGRLEKCVDPHARRDRDDARGLRAAFFTPSPFFSSLSLRQLV